MNLRYQTVVSHKKVTNWSFVSPFLTAMAGVGIGILFGFYLGLL
ncbi:MAG: hypothetical protein QNJ33_18105 [Crocosphaera sp.]|nr:hypothetical protein [Crocosphaera sp.]